MEKKCGRRKSMTTKKMTDLKKTVRSVLLTVLGTLILSFGTSVFLLPFDLVIGGMSGIAVVIDALIPIQTITVDMILTVLTWTLFFLGLLILGKQFALKTLISTVVYPIGVSIFMRLARPDVFGGIFCMTASKHPELALIISAAAGGAVIGTGCAVTFMGGGSTGGIDVIALGICKRYESVKSSTVIFIIDSVLITLGIFVLGDLVQSLLGIASALVFAIVLGKLF